MEKSYAAFLFDMDGTLITSTVSAERVWTEWASKHGIDAASLLTVLHGVRSVDTLRALNLPQIDAEAEAAAIEAAEIADTDGVAPIAGVTAFLAALPPKRWALVTSASLALARARLAAAGIALPPVTITAEDVARGKPDPQGYKLAAERLGVDPADCLVFEDAPAGLLAGEAAGADVLAISATHRHPAHDGRPSVRDYRELSVTVTADGRLLVGRTV
jgi:sugar-phosphatase